MSLPLLLLRPQPGNDASAKRARDMGLEVIQLPLFEIVAAAPAPLADRDFDAVLVTSANGVRFGADALGAFADLPLYAVGEATARAAREAGMARVRTGGGDVASTLALIAGDGHSRVLHVCGADVRPVDVPGIGLTRHVAYRAAPRDEAIVRPLLDAVETAVATIHSPRAGARFAALIEPARRGHFHVAAISDAAARETGTGWADMAVSRTPDDTALLHCAKALCIRAG